MARINKKKRNIRIDREGLDYTLIVILFFLLAFGLIMIYSASSYESMLKFDDSAYYFKHQLSATLIAIAVLAFFVFANYHLWCKISFWLYIGSMGLVFLVWTPLGMTINGARRWINFFGQSLQPAEPAKIGVILFTAWLLIKTKKEVLYSIKGFIKIMAPGALMAVIVLVVTSNLSSAIIIGGIPMIMYFIAVPGYTVFALVGGLGLAAAGGLVYMVATGIIDLGYRGERIIAWLHPEAYASDEGFQILQALYSIGSGGLFGKGLGQSIQKMGSLPEAQNDMIFSIICEELGLFGALAVVVMFLILLWRCMLVAQSAPDNYGCFLVTGVMAHIALQVIFNIGVVTNTLPNTGITLPFISYGGTSIVFILIEIGMVLNVSRERRYE